MEIDIDLEEADPRARVRRELRQVSDSRVDGLATAIDDLGTHTMHGKQVPYSRTAVWSVLTGRRRSDRLMEVIARRRPDLFGLNYVPEDVRRAGEELARRLEAEA